MSGTTRRWPFVVGAVAAPGLVTVGTGNCSLNSMSGKVTELGCSSDQLTRHVAP